MQLSNHELEEEELYGRILTRLGIGRIEFSMSGGGDEGNIEDREFFALDGSPLPQRESRKKLEEILFPQEFGFSVSLLEKLDNLANNNVGDYSNGNGGSASAVLELVDGRCECTETSFTEWEDDEEPEEDEWDEDDDLEP
ncbi:hypothetical protein ACEUZ9_004119 [Paracoccus litorisediminis]|uniref:hypothetical protein n=1 Tax=Paracoccus litorisediminis TaxID=2006130 RepID=UPI00372E7418